MRMFLTIFISVSIFSSTKAQSKSEHTEAKEYGFYGKVKTVVQYDFIADSTVKKDSAYYLVNRNGYELKRTYFFNPKGEVDSIVSLYPYKDDFTKKIIPVYNYLIYEFNNVGRKSGFKSYSNERNLDVQGEITWIDKTHYIQKNYEVTKDGKKSKIKEISFSLTDKFRELSYEVKTFGKVNGALLTHYIVTNSFDQAGYLEKKRVEYKAEAKGPDENIYKYQKYDKMKNPCETLEMTGDNKRLKTYILTEYSYY